MPAVSFLPQISAYFSKIVLLVFYNVGKKFPTPTFYPAGSAVHPARLKAFVYRPFKSSTHFIFLMA
jgi:hypothetical protein